VPRRFLLTIVLAVLAPLVGLAAPASAAPAPTQIHFAYVAGTVPRAGEPEELQAALASPPDAVAGRVLTLYARRAGTATYLPIAHGTTDSSGTADFRFTLAFSSTLQFRFDGDGQYAAANSSPVLWAVAPQVSLRVPTHVVQVGRTLVLSGRTYPIKPGHRVSLWRGQIPGQYAVPGTPAPVRIGTAVVGPDGTYRIVHRFPVVCDRRLFVSVSGGDGNARGYSNYVRVRVR
jgi:hypothetical protein